MSLRSLDGSKVLVLSMWKGSAVVLEWRKDPLSNGLKLHVPGMLAGIVVDWEERKATVVWATSQDATVPLQLPDIGDEGFQLSLAAASILLSLLGLYEESLPPLDRLGEKERKRIVRSNRLRLDGGGGLITSGIGRSREL